MIIEESDYLMHFGTPRHSGRYPWGSGGNENTRNRDLLDYVAHLRSQGMSETEIAKAMGMSTTQLRAEQTIARNEKRQADIIMAQNLKDKGYGYTAIGKRMGIPESTVRSLLAPSQKEKGDILTATSDLLRSEADRKGAVDVGSGVEHYLGISETKLKSALTKLEGEGYEVFPVQIDQLGTNNKTIVKVLSTPGTTYKDLVTDKGRIRQIDEIEGYSEDGGRTFLGILPPKNFDSKRLAINYAEDGGKNADGVMYVRRGVDDISIGGSGYAQVRVAVDGTHYLKGMAMYKDRMPDGVDIVFNTNKTRAEAPTYQDVLKPMKDNPNNPFGAVIKRQITKDGDNGKKELTSVMNLVHEEGDWDGWSRNLASQTLSKQSPKLAKTQLDMTFERHTQELNEIMSMTNPVVKQKLLQGFADGADSSSVHLKAAAIPRSSWHALLPFNSMKETEIYAPNYENGERVALIRYPHGGTFEIPELTVNNNHRAAKAAIGRAKDAVGINAKVAERLSGADFDGDAVLVIPNNSRSIKSSPALEGLKNFDARASYKLPEGQKFKGNTQQLMGGISNLITDMTIQKANNDEIARAVRHSMVVIDAEKHDLNYKQSAINNGIGELKRKYQGEGGGASTLISRAKSEQRVTKRKQGYKIDPVTGEKKYLSVGDTYVNRKGETKEIPGAYTNAKGQRVLPTQKSTKLAETKDAHTLSSGTPIEVVYANHSNKMKALGNSARKELANTKTSPANPSAKTAYAKEVASLDAKLKTAQRNRPLERGAQLSANVVVSAEKEANPNMNPAEIKKIKSQALEASRNRLGVKKNQIHITDAEWEAIQANAISPSKLSDIIDNAKIERVKELATPKVAKLMSTSKKNRAIAMAATGYTQAEIAQALGVSLSTLKQSIYA